MMKNIETTDWLIKDISKEQLETEKVLAIISNMICFKRHELKMDQKEFAKHMKITQGLVSRWESGRYNFTVSNLVSICEKLNMKLNLELLNEEKEIEKIVFVKQHAKEKENWTSWKPTKENIIYGGVA